uniref:Uncharacterized protein n=1 Tax=Saccharum hybrid cultivar R570 TaxID=131158 RepID=A0A059Q0C7_9POAL|nr:hypothetical protein SHCRBa_089_D15_F_90 [Saccharum hybrid cultivar R570]
MRHCAEGMSWLLQGKALRTLRYAGKRNKWRQEEREAAEARLENPLEGIDKRGREFFYGRRPKKLKEGRTKYNEPQTEVAEKALLVIKVAKERGEF